MHLWIWDCFFDQDSSEQQGATLHTTPYMQTPQC